MDEIVLAAAGKRAAKNDSQPRIQHDLLVDLNVDAQSGQLGTDQGRQKIRSQQTNYKYVWYEQPIQQ